MKEELIGTIMGIVFAYIVFGMFQLLVATVESDKKMCNHPPRRIEYILPGYRLGCWLNERVD